MSIGPLRRFVAVYRTRRGIHLGAIALATHEHARALPNGPYVPRDLEIVDVVEVQYVPPDTAPELAITRENFDEVLAGVIADMNADDAAAAAATQEDDEF